MGYPSLKAKTPEAAEAMQHTEVAIRDLPFRAGRESRFAMIHGKFRSMERRRRQAPPNNDIYLIDQSELLNISREHFLIEQKEDGSFELVDRGSTCGTFVDNERLGADTGRTRHALRNGSVIKVGTEDSPYEFEFVLPSGE